VPATAELIRNHIEYTIWASNRLLEAASTLQAEERQRDFGTADGSIQRTLTHVMQSERMWLRRIQEGTPTISRVLPGDDEWQTLIERWRGVHQEWRAWARPLTEEGADAIIRYADMKGNPMREPVWHIVLHVVNHGSHHRGQVSGFLRAMNTIPPPLDFIVFVRDKP
jgi:uncharacterized damage-inducible protein DinB